MQIYLSFINTRHDVIKSCQLPPDLVGKETYHRNDTSIMVVSSDILIHIPKAGKHITGELLSGIVRFHLDKDTVYKNIALSLVEEGECEWHAIEHHAEKISEKTVFLGQERNVIQKIYLLNKITDGDAPLLAGTYEYPFEITVPENTPPTVDTSIGNIKYQLILKFKKPGTFSWNKTFKKTVTIYPRIDSTLSDEPIFASLNKTLFKPFSSKQHEINLKIELDKAYMNPNGERNMSFVVNNNSGVIFWVQTELIDKTKYTYDNREISKTKVVESVETPEIPDYSESTMINIIPVAPDICTVRHSDVIKREYKLKITLKLPLPHVNSSVEIPVFVGENPAMHNAENVEEAGECSKPMDDPPSYWEVMEEDKSDKNDE